MSSAERGRKDSLLSHTILNRLSSLGTVLAVSGALLAAGAGQALAQSQVGDQIFVRGIGFLTITEVLADGGFLAGNPLNLFSDSEYIILGTTDAGVVAVGDMMIDPTTGVIAEVTAVVLNGYGELESVTFDTGSMVNLASELDVRGTGLAYSLNTPTRGPGDFNSVAVHRFGASGGNGRHGYPFREANNGAGGQSRTANTWEVPDTHGDFVTHTDLLAGVIATSLGGNSGNGGDGYAGASAAAGGAGGAGGTVILTTRVGNLTTYDVQAHGVVAQSHSGIGGTGGDVILSLGSGGTGGVGNSGGSATVNNYSTIITHGEGSISVFAQSLGGGGGVAGSSYGLLGAAGDGHVGGDNAKGAELVVMAMLDPGVSTALLDGGVAACRLASLTPIRRSSANSIRRPTSRRYMGSSPRPIRWQAICSIAARWSDHTMINASGPALSNPRATARPAPRIWAWAPIPLALAVGSSNHSARIGRWRSQ
ncbi:hypothetical protein [Maricaulis salignorans]|uniref:hypothetical protein n=1 Tax=Maricaulis salignorans TaxID=144026 RepID=UPI000B86F404|nr:hypothetical protein [Maricaulis salignorans]